MDFREAESAALTWMRKMDFVGAQLTQGGADGGIDVVSDVAVAQVKAEVESTGRPAVQRIQGVAANQGKKALFFSTAGYTKQASEWADEAGVALFVLDEYRRVRALNIHGQRIVDGQMASSKKSVESAGVSLRADSGTSIGPGVNLKFHLIECKSCGHNSPQAAGCQHCGATPPAEDPAVASRRRSVEAARSRIGSTGSVPSAVTGSETFMAILKAEPVERQIGLIADIDTADSGWQSRYAANIRHFERVKAKGLQSSNRADPVWTPVWSWNDKIFGAITDALDAFERSATASTPELAASYFADAQRAVDRAGELAEQSAEDLTKRSQQMERRSTSSAAASGWGCAVSILSLLTLAVLALSALIL